MIIENMKGKAVDIDNVFLNGDLEHEIYMKIPEGYDEVINPGVDKEDCLILQKANLRPSMPPSILSSLKGHDGCCIGGSPGCLFQMVILHRIVISVECMCMSSPGY